MEILKRNNEIIDSIIRGLEELKNNKVPISIDCTPAWVQEVKLVDGTMFAKKNINIDITYEELYTKNENDIFDAYKPYEKRRNSNGN